MREFLVPFPFGLNEFNNFDTSGSGASVAIRTGICSWPFEMS